MKSSIQSRQNALILNILFGIDDLVPNLGPIMEVVSDVIKFGTKNKWNIQNDIHCPDSGQISF